MEIAILAVIYKKIFNRFDFVNKMGKFIMRIKNI